MRRLLFVLLTPLLLTACGGRDEPRTVVVDPQPGQTVVVPPSTTVTRICPAGTVC